MVFQHLTDRNLPKTTLPTISDGGAAFRYLVDHWRSDRSKIWVELEVARSADAVLELIAAHADLQEWVERDPFRAVSSSRYEPELSSATVAYSLELLSFLDYLLDLMDLECKWSGVEGRPYKVEPELAALMLDRERTRGRKATRVTYFALDQDDDIGPGVICRSTPEFERRYKVRLELTSTKYYNSRYNELGHLRPADE